MTSGETGGIRRKIAARCPVPVAAAAAAFPILQCAYSSRGLPRDYVDILATWSVGVAGVPVSIAIYWLLLACFQLPVLRKMRHGRTFPRLSQAAAAAVPPFVAVFIWQVLVRCQEGRLFDKDGVVCAARSLGVAIPVFLAVLLVLSHPGRKARWLRLALAVLLAVLAVSAAGYLVAASLPARRIAARWAASGGQETRHVLLYVADTTRADALDYSKEPGSKTPRIAAWADSAAVFSHAYANASWTLPSHASLFTGELPCDHRAVSSHQWLSEEARTIAEQMRKNSFFTVGFSENPNVGRANNMDQGFDRYYRLYLNGGRMGYVFPAFVKRVARETDTALGLQSKPAASLASKLWPPCRGAAEITVLLRDLFESHAKAPLPLFVFVNVMDVHSPYHATEEGRRAALAHVDSTRLKELNGFDERRRDYGDYLAGGNVLSQADLRALRSLYQGEVGAVDKAFGDLLEGLNAQGVDERCLIVFTSDHGEEFGEHNLLSHHFCAYETLVRVPLIVRCPWEAAFANGRRYGVPVQLADLPPTIAHLMGVPWTPNPKSVGVNLVLAMNEASRVLYGQYDPHAGVLERLEREHPGHDFSRLDRRLAWSLDKAFKRIRASDGTVESYDLEEDPEESWDLNSQGSAESGILQEHERWLAQRPERTAVKTDPATQKRLRDLGYVQ